MFISIYELSEFGTTLYSRLLKRAQIQGVPKSRGKRRTKEYAVMTRDEGNEVDVPFSVTW
jgi:hypothetical protein